MAYLKKHYRLSQEFLSGALQEYLKNTTIAFCVIFVVFFVASHLLSPVLEGMMAYFQNVVDNAGITNENGGYSALAIAVNNLRASAMSILYGLIPFLFLPALPIGLNAAMLGAIAALYQIEGLSMLLLLAGLLPHGIFEIPALLISFACGLYLCRNITDHLRKKEDTQPPLSQCAAALLHVYVTIVVPLLLVAAVVEAYITPICMAFFL